MTGFEFGSKDRVYMDGFDSYLDDDKTTFYANFTPAPGKSRRISISRNVRSEEVDKLKMDMMPGFRFSWWYTGTEVAPDKTFTYNTYEYNKHFTRLAYDYQSLLKIQITSQKVFRFTNVLLNSRFDQKVIWSLIIPLRIEYLKNPHLKHKDCKNNFIPLRDMVVNLEKLSQMVGVIELSNKINSNFSKIDIDFSGKIFVTLNSCPTFFEKLYLKAIYETEKADTIAMLTSNIIKKSKPDFKIKALKIFAKISLVFRFQHISFYHETNASFEKHIELTRNTKGKIWLRQGR